jgi:hypothetical protein
MKSNTSIFLANSGATYGVAMHLSGVLLEVEHTPGWGVIQANGDSFKLSDGRWVDKYELAHRRECLTTFGRVVTPKQLRKWQIARGY